ncbi:hypothetical protein BDD12DRAFT_810533 [Trichophaea hybrida]|nr:hypothetical protein BDD12DRAFT_810533 [Trichophaea hybrida]
MPGIKDFTSTGSRSGASPSSRPALRWRGLGVCHTLNRVNTAYKTVNDSDFGSHLLEHKNGSLKTVREHLKEICDVYYEVPHGNWRVVSAAALEAPDNSRLGNTSSSNRSSAGRGRVSERKRIEVEISSSDNENTSDIPRSQKRIKRGGVAHQELDTVTVYTAEAKLFEAGGMTEAHRRVLARQKEEDREIEREKLRLQRSELEFKREELEVCKLEARANLLENGAA